MAVVKDPIGKARAANTPRKAARLIAELEPELALNTSLPDGWEQEAEEALRIVKAAHPQAEEMSYQLDTPVTVSRATQQAQAGPQDPATPKSAASRNGGGAPAKTPGSRSSSPGRAARRAPARGRSGGRGRRAGRSAWRATGIPSATSGTTRTVMGLIGGALGLTFLYLLLSNPKAVQIAAGGAAGLVRGLVAPVDPLRPVPREIARPQSSAARPAPQRALTAPSPIRTR